MEDRHAERVSDDREIPGGFVAEINRLLQEAGFRPPKGAARQLARLYRARDPSARTPEWAEVVRLAEEQGIPRPHAPSPPAPVVSPLPENALRSVVAAVRRRLAARNVLDPILQELVEEAVDGQRYRIVVDRTPWDVSTRAEPTGCPYDLAAYRTVADFLQEPTGNTLATYLSGSGLRAETYEDWVETWLSTLVAETIRQALTPFLDSEMGNAGTDPEDVLAVWSEQVWDVLADREPPEDRLLRRLCRQDWAAVIARYRPDALPRLEADRLRQARRETLLQELQARLAASPCADAEEQADDVHRAVAWTLWIAGDPDGWAALATGLARRQLSLPLSPAARQAWVRRLRACLDALPALPVDADGGRTPLISLWRFLTGLWLRDGRPWLVTFAFPFGCRQYGPATWEWFLVAAGQTVPLLSPSTVVSVVLRRLPGVTGEPAEVAGLILRGEEVIPVPAEEVRQASLQDAQTGEPLSPEPGVRYVAAETLLAGWACLSSP